MFRAHGRELGVDGVMHEEIDTVVTEAGAGIIEPAIEQCRRALNLPAQAKGDAPVFDNPAVTRRETARKNAR